jgi:hypothetical protein
MSKIWIAVMFFTVGLFLIVTAKLLPYNKTAVRTAAPHVCKTERQLIGAAVKTGTLMRADRHKGVGADGSTAQVLLMQFIDGTVALIFYSERFKMYCKGTEVNRLIANKMFDINKNNDEWTRTSLYKR